MRPDALEPSVRTPRPEPCVVVELRLEASPRVQVIADTAEDFARLADFITNNRRLHQLVIDAIELSPFGRAA